MIKSKHLLLNDSNMSHFKGIKGAYTAAMHELLDIDLQKMSTGRLLHWHQISPISQHLSVFNSKVMRFETEGVP